MANHTKRVTIQEIADHAKVSTSTVSRVLNAKGYISLNKRQAVLEAIEELNYRPNVFAQSLASGQSRTIGVLTQLLGSPIYDLILRSIVETLNGSEYSPLIADGYWIADKEREAIQTFRDRSTDGLIILGGSLPAEEIITITQQIPTVVIARDIPELASQSIPIDNADGARLATQHLIECGHRRIAHIRGLENHEDAELRIEGYQRALQDAHITSDPDLVVQGDYTEASGIMAVEILFTRGVSFSAIFAANDQMAVGARLALYRRGIRVPEDISLVGFDDQPVSAFMTPPLTTVGVPPLEIGRIATHGLLNLLKGKPCDMPPTPIRLYIRESVARR
jgi:LacI family transcriptional regulator